MERTIYAVYDIKAQDIVGSIHLFAHDAVAVRMFTDAYEMEGTIIKAHPEDFKLVALGNLKNTDITPEYRVILTGEALHAAKQLKQER